MLRDVVVGIAGNLATAVLAAMLFAGWYILNAKKAVNRHRRFLAFFGVESHRSKIKIVVSQIVVHGRDNTSGTQDVLEGFRGACICQPEYDAALSLKQSLVFRWFPVFPRGLLETMYKRQFAGVEIDPSIEASCNPDTPDKVVDAELAGNVIIVGSGIYNKYADRFASNDKVIVRFRRDGQTQQVFDVKSGQRFSGREKGYETAFIQRIKSSTGVIVQCAGAGAGATADAVKYLLASWERIEKDAAGSNFALVLTWKYVGDVDKPSGRNPDTVFRVLENDVAGLP